MATKNNNEPKNFYIADMHFGHTRVIEFDGRPFSDLADMKKSLVKNWNSCVTNIDTVYILGDFCWGKEDEWKRLLRKLNGKKVLIQGNHDLKTMSSELRNMFQDVKPYKEIKDSGYHIIMSHYPIMFYKKAYNPKMYMLCGHVHKTRENDFLQEWRKKLIESKTTSSDSCGNVINVGCMMPWMDYFPRTIQEIIDGDTAYRGRTS